VEWLREFRAPRDGAATLVCFPHAGGGAGAYAAWRDLLPSGLGALRRALSGP